MVMTLLSHFMRLLSSLSSYYWYMLANLMYMTLSMTLSLRLVLHSRCISASEYGPAHKSHKTWRRLRLGALSETRSAYELDGTQPHTPTTSGTLNWTPQRSIHPPKAGEDCSNKNVKSNVRNRWCECKGAPPNTSCYCFHLFFFSFWGLPNLTRAEKLQAGPGQGDASFQRQF